MTRATSILAVCLLSPSLRTGVKASGASDIEELMKVVDSSTKASLGASASSAPANITRGQLLKLQRRAERAEVEVAALRASFGRAGCIDVSNRAVLPFAASNLDVCRASCTAGDGAQYYSWHSSPSVRENCICAIARLLPSDMVSDNSGIHDAACTKVAGWCTFVTEVAPQAHHTLGALPTAVLHAMEAVAKNGTDANTSELSNLLDELEPERYKREGDPVWAWLLTNLFAAVAFIAFSSALAWMGCKYLSRKAEIRQLRDIRVPLQDFGSSPTTLSGCDEPFTSLEKGDSGRELE
mmetsp:Transcript_22104/g.38940  ORF Transcript_22104/g.38940 Transcript_22104/m.38940 type:complete len:296 (+) Transcript_22104:69-956(+)